MDEDYKAVRIKKKRPCHDCGKMQQDYRCFECWQKLRKKARLNSETDACGVDDDFLFF